MTLDDMHADLGAILDPLDIPGDWTPRQREAYETKRSWLRASDSGCVSGPGDTGRVRVPYRGRYEVATHLTDWRQVLCDELLAIPGRHDMGRQTNSAF